MKSFLWRLGSNALWFAIALAVFTCIYIPTAHSDVWYSYHYFHFKHIDPFLISLFVGFAYFLLFSKRNTYEEEYLYGRSRKYAFCVSQCAAAVYALLFACYEIGLALLVRRSLFTGDVIVQDSFYCISAAEIFYNFISLFIVNMLMFEVADMLRKFKSYKFWTVVAILAVAVVTVCVIYVNIATLKWFNYWIGMFVIFTLLLIIAVCCNLFMTRGRQRR